MCKTRVAINNQRIYCSSPHCSFLHARAHPHAPWSVCAAAPLLRQDTLSICVRGVDQRLIILLSLNGPKFLHSLVHRVACLCLTGTSHEDTSAARKNDAGRRSGVVAARRRDARRHRPPARPWEHAAWTRVRPCNPLICNLLSIKASLACPRGRSPSALGWRLPSSLDENKDQGEAIRGFRRA